MQEDFDKSELMPELLIHFGEISGFYHQFVGIPKEVENFSRWKNKRHFTPH